MRSLRLWIIITGVWLTFFFNIERIIFYQVDANIIRSDTYIFVAIVALVTLLLPRLSGTAFSGILVVTTSLFLVLWYHDPRWGQSVASKNFTPLNATALLAIIQIIAIILTGLLARQIGYEMTKFEDVIADITFGYIGTRPTSFAEEQSEMYREVRRAARYGRPLAMIALKIDADTLQMPLPQIVKEVQRAMMREFTMAAIARVLDDNMLGFDTIALRDNYFIVTMPETGVQDIPDIVQKLEKVIGEKINIPVYIGTASFPDEAVTFESLVELAVDKAEQQPIEKITVEHSQHVVVPEI